MNDDELLVRCTVHSRSEIIALLNSVKKRKLLVSLDLPASRRIIVTSIIAIDYSNGSILLDCARSDALNRELLSAAGSEFVTQIDGVSITFSTGQVSLCEYWKLPALRIPLPESLIRLQRREHFRVQLSAIHPVKCVIPPMQIGNAQAITPRIADIGCGGLAITETGGYLGTETDRILPGCQLLLPETEAITISLNVRNSAQVKLKNGTLQTRLGCKFVDFPNSMIPLLQRFVTDIELRRNRLYAKPHTHPINFGTP